MYNQYASIVKNHSALLTFWDFQEQAGNARIASGKYPYRLLEQTGLVERIEDGIFGAYAAHVSRGQWLSIPRSECPALDFHGQDANFTMMAWIKRDKLESAGCEAIAGMWNETDRKRQYCMFLNLEIWDSAEQACGHVSSVGGPTPGYKYCMTSAIGNTTIDKEEWHAVAFTYDGKHSRIYVDGKLDVREDFNPFLYDQGLYDGGEHGADFTVGAVHRSGEMGNFFAGLLGGLAIFDQALDEEEIASLIFV